MCPAGPDQVGAKLMLTLKTRTLEEEVKEAADMNEVIQGSHWQAGQYMLSERSLGFYQGHNKVKEEEETETQVQED